MTDNKNVVPYPSSDEEKAGLVIAEAERLSRQSALERTFWMKRSAERLGINVEELKILVEAAVKEREKKEAEAKAEERRQEQRVERQRGSEEKRRRASERAEERRCKVEQEAIDNAAQAKEKAKQKALLTSPNCRWRSTRRSLCKSPPSLISTFISFVTSFQS